MFGYRWNQSPRSRSCSPTFQTTYCIFSRPCSWLCFRPRTRPILVRFTTFCTSRATENVTKYLQPNWLSPSYPIHIVRYKQARPFPNAFRWEDFCEISPRWTGWFQTELRGSSAPLVFWHGTSYGETGTTWNTIHINMQQQCGPATW